MAGSIPAVPIRGGGCLNRPHETLSPINVYSDKVNVSDNPHEALHGVVQANRPIGRTVRSTWCKREHTWHCWEAWVRVPLYTSGVFVAVVHRL